MIFIFNRIAVGISLVSGFLASLVLALGFWFNEEWLLSHFLLVQTLALGVFMTVLDIWYRMTRGKRSMAPENTNSSLLQPRCGGHVCYIPVWIHGGLCIVTTLVGAFESKPAVSARQSNP